MDKHAPDLTPQLTAANRQLATLMTGTDAERLLGVPGLATFVRLFLPVLQPLMRKQVASAIDRMARRNGIVLNQDAIDQMADLVVEFASNWLLSLDDTSNPVPKPSTGKGKSKDAE